MHRTIVLLVTFVLVLSACARDTQHRTAEFEVRRAALLGASDSVSGVAGPKLSGLSQATEVWSVTRDWSDVTPEAGLAWGANSGLSWSEKYAAWVDDFGPTTASTHGQTTFLLTTPWGKSLEAPRLECAETAIFLRATFAAWHGLPMYLAAYSPSHGATIYFGHFGVVDGSGAGVSGFPSFQTWYQDYTESHGDLPTHVLLNDWPSSQSLAQKALSANHDDAVSFLGPDAFAGAYFDALFLNKRVGEFLIRALTNLGSMHIVDATHNTFNLEPVAMRPGDLMMQRWQEQGIGHTVVLLRVERPGPNSRAIEVAYGSMPRIQPKWKSGAAAEAYFTPSKSGGVGANAAGKPYAALGGGLKRWRVPVVQSGRWRNVVDDDDEEVWINASHLEDIAARPAELEALFAGPDADEEKALLLTEIADARAELRQRPSSCYQRTRREAAFEELYALNAGWFGTDVEATDRAHRILDDYVFAELQYGAARTCCWNSTNAAMYDLIMAFNEAHTWNAATQTCHQPVVFKAVSGEYAVFEDYAASVGQASVFKPWSADESCSQVAYLHDLEAPHAWTPLCEIADDLLDTTPASETEIDTDDTEPLIDADDAADAVSGGWFCGASPEAPASSWLLMLAAIGITMLRRHRATRPC